MNRSGNLQAKSKILEYLKSHKECFIAIRGPHGIGKRFFLENIESNYERVIRLESDIEQIQDFLSYSSFSNSSSTLVIIPCIDRFSFVHQDALLRILEKPPEFHHIITTFVADHNIQASIHSRMDEIFTFLPWSDSEILSWCSEMKFPTSLVNLSGGIPGLLVRLSQDPVFEKILSWVENPHQFLRQNHRDPLSHMKTIEDKMYFLEFMGIHHQSLSADLHRRFRESMNLTVDLHFQDIILQSIQYKGFA